MGHRDEESRVSGEDVVRVEHRGSFEVDQTAGREDGRVQEGAWRKEGVGRFVSFGEEEVGVDLKAQLCGQAEE